MTSMTGASEEFEIFVERFVHFMNLWIVYRDLLTRHYVPSVGPPSQNDDPFPDMTTTLMFLLYSMFFSLIEDEKNSVNAFRVWRQRFPEEEIGIRAVEIQIAPFSESLRRFRNRLGFHGSRSRAHEATGFDLFNEHSGDEILTGMANFKHFGATLLAKELIRQKQSAGSKGGVS